MKKVIVIGSGFAGLAAATTLAKAGYAVSVIEKNDTFGGRARNFESEGFMFDMGPSWYWMPEVFEHFFQQFGRRVSDFYDLRLLDPAFQIFYGKNDVLQIPENGKELRNLFESIENGAGKKLDAFLAEAAYKYKIGMERLVHKPGLSLTEFADRDFLKGALKMHVFQSFHSYVRKHFQDPRLVRLMEFPVLFLGGAPKNTPALYSLMNYAGLRLGTWYPMGGMYEIIAGMVALAESMGVEFVPSDAVRNIAVRYGKACGVYTDSGYYSADAVVAAADYHHVEQNLLLPKDRSYDNAYWQSRVMAPSSLIFYLGLNKKIDGLQHHNLFFDEDLDVHADEIYHNQQWPSKPLFYVCCPSKTDDSVAPDGCENLFVLIPLAPGLKDVEEMREKYFKIVIGRLEALVGKEIASHVIFKRSYCINDFENDYNAFRGNAYGLANTLRQTAIFKPSLRSKKVENLFFAGQLTVPGPGVPPSLISGQIAARELDKYLKSGTKRSAKLALSLTSLNITKTDSFNKGRPEAHDQEKACG